MARGGLVAVACVLVATACAGNGARTGSASDADGNLDAPTSADPHKVNATVRGIVSVVGSEPHTTVLVTPPDAPPVALAGDSAALVAPLAGLDVEVTGARSSEAPAAAMPGTMTLVVNRFIVRAADGVPAHDGVIEERAGTWYLRLEDGSRVAVPALPAPLRRHVGARVYLAGPLDRAPASYGVIAGEGK